MKNNTFAGLQIAPANLIFDGNKFAIAKDWKVNSFEKTFGKKEGSTYFNWHECHDVNIEGWRVPTRKEWEAVAGDEREGSVYNGLKHACFAVVEVSVPFGNKRACDVLLLFPDGINITGPEIRFINEDLVFHDSHLITRITEQQLNTLLDQGCTFLPAFGKCDKGIIDGKLWFEDGYSGFYWSSTGDFEDSSCYLYFCDSCVIPFDYNEEWGRYFPVRLVRDYSVRTEQF